MIAPLFKRRCLQGCNDVQAAWCAVLMLDMWTALLTAQQSDPTSSADFGSHIAQAAGQIFNTLVNAHLKELEKSALEDAAVGEEVR